MSTDVSQSGDTTTISTVIDDIGEGFEERPIMVCGVM